MEEVVLVLELGEARLVDFALLDGIRQVVSVIVYPLQRLATAPGAIIGRIGDYFVSQTSLRADNTRLIVNSRLNSAVYVYSLPDLKLVGSADVGVAPDWVTLTPDGKMAYVANAGSNSVSVVDMAGVREVTRIPVGQVPKRNITAMLAQ